MPPVVCSRSLKEEVSSFLTVCADASWAICSSLHLKLNKLHAQTG
jgi:hypothetical protein